MSSRLVKKQLNSLIVEKQQVESDAKTRGVKKRTAKRKVSRSKLAKKVLDEQVRIASNSCHALVLRAQLSERRA